MRPAIMIAVLIGLISVSCFEETPVEKVKAKADNVQREVNKTSNRTDESVCGDVTGDSRSECLAKKVRNRVVETKDAFVHKTKELKNKMDTN